MADTALCTDLRTPYNIVAPASVSPLSTAVALHLPATIGNLGNQNWTPGKSFLLVARGLMTSAATPGNFSILLYWGTGASANGTILCTSAATAWTANQSAMTWEAQIWITVTAIGATGTICATGRFKVNEAAIAAELQLPATTPANVTVDTTTANNVFSLQAIRSGSTAETMQLAPGFPKLFALN